MADVLGFEAASQILSEKGVKVTMDVEKMFWVKLFLTLVLGAFVAYTAVYIVKMAFGRKGSI
jgi:hypothetical protein